MCKGLQHGRRLDVQVEFSSFRNAEIQLVFPCILLRGLSLVILSVKGSLEAT